MRHLGKVFGLLLSFGLQATARAEVEADSPYWIQVIKEGTKHKRFPTQAAEQDPYSEVCDIPGNAVITLSAAPLRLTNGHYLINRADIGENCSFSSGFIYVGHVKKVSATEIKETAISGFSVKVLRDTWFQRGTGNPESMVLGQQKCTLHHREAIKIQGPPMVFDEKHYVVNLAAFLPGCDFSQGIIKKDDIHMRGPFVAEGTTQNGRRLANNAYRVASRMWGTGRCYRGVADAMVMTFGGNPWEQHRIPGASAYQFGRWANQYPQKLAQAFHLQRVNMTPWQAPIGSVFVFEPGYRGSHPYHGHIEIKVNHTTVCSDFCASIYRQPSYIYAPYDSWTLD